MKKYAIVSDIHANWEALSAVEGHAKSEGVDSFINLGDVVGYGGSPVECLEWVIDNCGINILGNHEIYVLKVMNSIKEAPGSNTLVVNSAYWTTFQFPVAHKEHILDQIEQWPQEGLWNDFYLVHGSPFMSSMEERYKSTSEYFIVPGMGKEFPWKEFKQFISSSQKEVMGIFDRLQAPLCFLGHAHIPCVIEGIGKKGLKFNYAMPGDSYEIPEGAKVIINPGSVGQPRDSNPLASYATFHDGVVEFHRVEYDFKTAQRKIMEGSGIEIHAERLSVGR